jgi:two-component system OmpR family sensor kinase
MRWRQGRWRQRSLQTRLVVGVVVLLAAGLALANVAAVYLVSTYQQQRIDQQLSVPDPNRSTLGGGMLSTTQLCQFVDQAAAGTQQLPTSYVIAVTDAGGQILCQLPREPQVGSRPDLASVSGKLSAVAASQKPLTVPDAGHGAPWRVKVAATSGGYVVVGVSLADAVETFRHLQLSTLLVSAAILLLGGFGSRYVVRFALRPLTAIERTAQAIAGGDLSQRVDEPPADTEIGRLTASLNAMLAQIEQGFDHQVATEERLRRFIADASHELRTPLASIRGHAEMYRQGVVTRPEEIAVVMNRIEAESIRMGDLVNDMLLLVRLDGEPGMTTQPVDLLSVSADTVLDARARDPHRVVTLTQLSGEGWVDAPPVVLGDESRVRQVVGNVVANVLRHTPAGSPYEVTVGVRADPGGASMVQVSVVDHGPGLPPEAAGKVFERFYRLDYGRARSDGGTGLGLSIAAGLMAAHGGTITYSDTPGGGSTFTLSFPPASGEQDVLSQ